MGCWWRARSIGRAAQAVGGLVLLGAAACSETSAHHDPSREPERLAHLHEAARARQAVAEAAKLAAAPVEKVALDLGAKTLASTAVTSAIEPAANVVPSEPAVPEPEGDHFFEHVDAPIRERLAREALVSAERGRGGRSLGFKVTLADGTKGYFKAEQSFSAANWYAEVTAYHLDRMLGLGRIPAVVSRAFAWKDLRAAAGSDWRRKELTIRKDGTLRGALIWWIPGRLGPLKQPKGWERWVRVTAWPSTTVSPYQRAKVWKDQLDRLKQEGVDWISKSDRLKRRNQRPEPDRDDRPAELSDMIIFDYLTKNIDRWGGGNANVLTRGPHGPLVFLDNGAGFEPGPSRPSLMEARLHVLQKFRKSTIERVRALDMDELAERLSQEALAPVLTRAQLGGLEDRRKGLLEWVAEAQGRYGDQVFAWP